MNDTNIPLITEAQIEENGLKWVRSFPIFKVEGNHYKEYPDILRKLNNFKVTVELRGSGDHGLAIATFERRPNIDVIKEHMGMAIKNWEDRFGVKIVQWEVVDEERAYEALRI